jgi:hypothetical protein
MKYLTHAEVLEILAGYLDADAHTDGEDNAGNRLIRASNVPKALDYIKNAPDWNQ